MTKITKLGSDTVRLWNQFFMITEHKISPSILQAGFGSHWKPTKPEFCQRRWCWEASKTLHLKSTLWENVIHTGPTTTKKIPLSGDYFTQDDIKFWNKNLPSIKYKIEKYFIVTIFFSGHYKHLQNWHQLNAFSITEALSVSPKQNRDSYRSPSNFSEIP